MTALPNLLASLPKAALMGLLSLADISPATTQAAPPATEGPSTAVRPTAAPSPVQIERALASLPKTPTLSQVQHASISRALLSQRVTRRWLRRARTAGLLPTLSVGYDLRADRGWSLDQEAGVADELQNDLGNVSTLRLKASWDLDRAWFDPDELRAARAALDYADWRERVLVEVTHLFFERQRLLLTRLLDPAADATTAIDIEVRLRELEGVLQGLTGIREGWTSVPRLDAPGSSDIVRQ